MKQNKSNKQKNPPKPKTNKQTNKKNPNLLKFLEIFTQMFTFNRWQSYNGALIKRNSSILEGLKAAAELH